ncbi:hypothetical protein RF55_16665 [Lasius niger]|uniref:Uncharacterized protein n=1 Tax=Lasius niger TaxID=67767 RepID=A0A0J7K3Y1_LASNI|nr:hypothetical protein RF55_16665 [Lasius niger]
MTNEMAEFQAKSPSFLKSWLWVNILYLFPASLTAPLWDILFPDLDESLSGFFHDWAVPFIAGNLLALLFLTVKRMWRKIRHKAPEDFVPLTPAKAVVSYILPLALAMTVDIAIEAWWTVPPADRGDYAMGSYETFLFTYGMEFLVFWGLAILLTILTDSTARLLGVAHRAIHEVKEKKQLEQVENPQPKALPVRFVNFVGRALLFWVRSNICYIIPGALIWPLWGFFMGNGEFVACLSLWGLGALFGNAAALLMIVVWLILSMTFKGIMRGFGYQVISKPETSSLQIEGTGVFSLESTIGEWDWGTPLGRTFFICIVFWGVSQVVSYFAERYWTKCCASLRGSKNN